MGLPFMSGSTVCHKQLLVCSCEHDKYWHDLSSLYASLILGSSLLALTQLQQTSKLPLPKKTERWAALCHRMQTDSFQCRFNSYHCLGSATPWAEKRRRVCFFSQHTDTLQLLQRQAKPDHQPAQKYFNMRSNYFENTDQLQFLNM